MNSIAYFIQHASYKLITKLGLEKGDALFEVRLLLQDGLGVDRSWLITHEQDFLASDLRIQVEMMLQRRLDGEPIAYIIGTREFYGLLLKVSSATLIPRSDTETLVDSALQKIPVDVPFNILDLGTGTGAVALAIAKHRPQCSVIAIDASPEALAVAIQNALNLNLNNVQLLKSNWFSELVGQKFDVIVSNPPYIAESDMHLKQGDLRFEPITALASGQDGLDDIRRIIQDAPSYLNPKGWLMLEHGYDQAQSVAELLKGNGFSQIDHARDLAGILRVTFGSIA
jgi:release factor glutamine methyltransferase